MSKSLKKSNRKTAKGRRVKLPKVDTQRRQYIIIDGKQRYKGTQHKPRKGETRKVSKKLLQSMCVKYNLQTHGSRKSLAERLSSLRGSYLTNTEKLRILPFLKNNKNKKLLMKSVVK